MYIKSNLFSTIFKLVLTALSALALYLVLYGDYGYLSLRQLSYYTVQSNILCFCYFLCALISGLLNHKSAKTRMLLPRFKGAVVIAVMTTFVIYHFILRPVHLQVGASLGLSNMLTHYIVPIMTLSDWLLFSKKGDFRKDDPILWTVIPFSYLAFALIRAQLGGLLTKGSRYPYFFIDIDAYGITHVALNCLIFAAVYIIFGYALLLVDTLGKKLGR